MAHLLRTLATFLCVMLASLAFAAQGVFAARASIVRRDVNDPPYGSGWGATYGPPTGPLPGYPPPK
uniref:Predicted protein n=1 Tax=Hordeum vulgare subsp. vulgare TaxID=112509 RepID=F2E4V1_HORVV|nr:predicted protein [Hordeum vulgare subsp. vulgare]